MTETRLHVHVALWAAVAFVLMSVVSIPILPSAQYLRYEPSDVAVFMCGWFWGKGAVVACLVVKEFLYFLFRAKSPFGPLGDFAAAAPFLWFAIWVLEKRKLRTSALSLGIALLVGTAARVGFAIPANFVILPLQFGMSFAAVEKLILPVIVPFNVLKGGLNGAVAAVVVTALAARLPGFRREGSG